MTSLIARLEAATGPSRELDAEIAKALGLPHGPWEQVHIESRSISHGPEQAPRYTGSVDCAMTLIPGGWPYQFCQHSNNQPSWAACYLTHNNGDTIKHVEAEAATPALALVIAALRAREG